MSHDLSTKLQVAASPGSEEGHTLMHWCPGCKSRHLINIEKPNLSNAVWRWDGNVESPTFTPSINIIGHCHYFITAGKISFCADSTHELAGKTVDLPEIPTWIRR